MKTDNLIRDLSYQFSLKIIETYKLICNQQKEFTLSKQLLRAATSIGANVREATQAESRADFVHKLRIALKEATETEYWIELLRDSKYIDLDLADSLIDDCRSLIRILTSIIIKTNKNSVNL